LKLLKDIAVGLGLKDDVLEL